MQNAQVDVGSQMFTSMDRKHEDWQHIVNTVMSFGSATPVDVDTGITSASPAASAISSLPVSADCSGATLARTADSTKICNLSASALTIAASGINVFVGYEIDSFDPSYPAPDAVWQTLLARSPFTNFKGHHFVHNSSIPASL